MSSAMQHNIGGFVKCVAGTRPLDAPAGAITTLWIDRLGYESMVAFIALGSASGTPDSFSVPMKVQHSDDSGGSGAVDYKPDGSNVAQITALTADTGTAELDVDLGNAKRYIGLVVTPAFVNGTSPKIEVATTIVLGGAVALPAA